MVETDSRPPGLFASLRRVVETIVDILQNRLELITVEVQQEKCRVIELLILAAAVIFCGFMAVALLTLTIVLLFAPEARVYALGALTLIYFGAAAAAVFGLKSKLKNPPYPFAGTISELKKDRTWLQSRK